MLVGSVKILDGGFHSSVVDLSGLLHQALLSYLLNVSEMVNLISCESLSQG